MNIRITPTRLHGSVVVPSSKSIGHRELICAALAQGESVVENISVSQDIEATCRLLQAFGASIEEIPSAYEGRTAYRVKGGLTKQGEALTVDCGESGSTLRFLIPIGLYSGNAVVYTGRGQLVKRPLEPYYRIFDEHGVSYKPTEGGLPLTVEGCLQPGRYALAGDVSSQFFTGLLVMLPLLDGDSVLESTTPLESLSYVTMTLDCMARHGVDVQWDGGRLFHIPGNQRYMAGTYAVEGDYSQAAFWLVAGTLGHSVECLGLRHSSSQGDEVIVSILQRMGAVIGQTDSIAAHPAQLTGQVIDVEDCPDLVPILAVAASCGQGTTHIIHGARVRLKECDRLHAIATELNKIGGCVEEEPDGLIIRGVGVLTGGRVSGWNDHRIAMALAIASQRCSGELIIEGAECVRKSYPDFWQDFAKLGGIYRVEE